MMTQSPPIENPHDPGTWPTGRSVPMEPLVRRVLAHLVDLERQGRVVAEGERWLAPEAPHA